ncbi:hypothetical protein PINS_up013655 [Pythium insidiosum]|nr:hypothetical protein PINS_up013655 [Pythium insidiosum]
MGQCHGKATYIKAAAPFLNGTMRCAPCIVGRSRCGWLAASEKDVNRLWESFNDVAEGFGLNQDELSEICRTLMPTLEIHARVDMDQLSAALFTALDTDEVSLPSV